MLAMLRSSLLSLAWMPLSDRAILSEMLDFTWRDLARLGLEAIAWHAREPETVNLHFTNPGVAFLYYSPRETFALSVRAMITPAQIRAGRGMLGWPARVLAERAGIHITTVQRIERSTDNPRGNVTTLAKIQQTLEAAGVEFLDGNGVDRGPGVRLNTIIRRLSEDD